MATVSHWQPLWTIDIQCILAYIFLNLIDGRSELLDSLDWSTKISYLKEDRKNIKLTLSWIWSWIWVNNVLKVASIHNVIHWLQLYTKLPNDSSNGYGYFDDDKDQVLYHWINTISTLLNGNSHLKSSRPIIVHVIGSK